MTTLTKIPTYFAGGEFQRDIEMYRCTALSYFHRFERMAGVVLPSDENIEAAFQPLSRTWSKGWSYPLPPVSSERPCPANIGQAALTTPL